jgi:hypothetical protein
VAQEGLLKRLIGLLGCRTDAGVSNARSSSTHGETTSAPEVSHIETIVILCLFSIWGGCHSIPEYVQEHVRKIGNNANWGLKMILKQVGYHYGL